MSIQSTKLILRNNQNVSISIKQPSGYIHSVDKQNDHMPAEYMQEEGKSVAFERTLNKRDQNDLINSWA